MNHIRQNIEDKVGRVAVELGEGVDSSLERLRAFFKLESSGGLLLMAATVFAMICANTPLSYYYDVFLKTYVTVAVGDFGVDKPLIFWINDGLMAVFFLLVGLEIKREILEGELSSVNQALLPMIAAAGGIVVPALIYVYFTQDASAEAMRGWAIPAATDIAFALGILSLFGRRVPIALKIFLTAVAVIDDLAAIVIIAVFYTEDLSTTSLIIAMICTVGLLILNLRKSQNISAYVFVGIIMWLAVLKSGVHATLAGVVLGLLIPHKVEDKHGHSLLRELEHNLHPWVAYLVLPMFAFANAGIDLHGMSADILMQPVPLGIAAGLIVGKQIGVFGFSWIAIKAGFAKLPVGVNWLQFYAVCVLCGIGFTMSLFIGSLAFESYDLKIETRVGVMLASIISGMLGYTLLKISLRNAPEVATTPSDPPAKAPGH